MQSCTSATTAMRSRNWLFGISLTFIALGSFFITVRAHGEAGRHVSSPGGYTAQALPDQGAASQGGFTGPGAGASVVNEVLAMRDDAYVVLRGRIVRNLGGERYLFQDDTGTLSVEIDYELWQGQYIGPEDLVEIHGEVDRDLFSLEVEADRIIKR